MHIQMGNILDYSKNLQNIQILSFLFDKIDEKFKLEQKNLATPFKGSLYSIFNFH